MKMYYITLNNQDDAKAISLDLLEKHLAACTNWFPIQSMYRWENKIEQHSEVALIIKTQEGLREKIEKIIAEHVDYTNYIAEIDVHSVNDKFLAWLKCEIKIEENL